MPHTDSLVCVAPTPRLAVVESQAQPDLATLLNSALSRIVALEAQMKSPTPPTAARGKPGRPAVNADIAAFANPRRPGMTWKAIYYAWKREHPHDPRNEELTAEKVRGAWRRHFGGKDKHQLP